MVRVIEGERTMAKKPVKKPAKKKAPKRAVKAAQGPSEARSPQKRGKGTPRPRKAVKAAVSAAEDAFRGASGAVSFWWGRLRWREEGPGWVSFTPYVAGDFLHRVSLRVDFGAPVESALVTLGDAGYGPKVEGSQVLLRFQPPDGKLQGSLVIQARLQGNPSGPPRVFSAD